MSAPLSYPNDTVSWLVLLKGLRQDVVNAKAALDELVSSHGTPAALLACQLHLTERQTTLGVAQQEYGRWIAAREGSIQRRFRPPSG